MEFDTVVNIEIWDTSISIIILLLLFVLCLWYMTVHAGIRQQA